MESASVARPLSQARPSVSSGVRELIFVFIAYQLYYQVRGISATRDADAFRNAFHIMDLERNIGIYWEMAMQSAVLSLDPLIYVFNVLYFYTLFPLLLPTAVWLFVWRPHIYELARDAFFISGAIALLFYALLPTAPPRLMGIGFVDTLPMGLVPVYTNMPGVNQFAAFPSMHVGWNFLIAQMLFLGAGKGRVRWLLFTLPVAMTLSTIFTGNHYILDAPPGILVAVTGYLIALAIHKRRLRADAEDLAKARADG